MLISNEFAVPKFDVNCVDNVRVDHQLVNFLGGEIVCGWIGVSTTMDVAVIFNSQIFLAFILGLWSL